MSSNNSRRSQSPSSLVGKRRTTTTTAASNNYRPLHSTGMSNLPIHHSSSNSSSTFIHNTSNTSNSNSSTNSSIPKAPSWLNDRVYMNHSYLTSNNNNKTSHEPISIQQQQQQQMAHSLPTKVQELVLIDELLSAMVGFEGKYISFTRKSLTSENGHSPSSSSSSLVFTQHSPSSPSSSSSTVPAHVGQNTFASSFHFGSNNQQQQSKANTSAETMLEEFCLRPGVWEPSLSYLVQRILPICNKYISISAFVQSRDSSYEYGLVSQAFVASVKILIQEYLVFVAQLESLFHKQNLTLQQIWFHVQQPLRTLTTVETLTKEIWQSRAKGGKLLTIIHRLSLIMAGDAETQKLFQFMLEKACAPFFTMVNDWVYGGLLDDSFGEFMICYNQPSSDVDNDSAAEYWRRRFTIRKEQVPDFLSESLNTKILHCGKYLNVLRCGQSETTPHITTQAKLSNLSKADKIDYTSHKREYVTKIESAYASASKQLLTNILQESKLMDLLNSMRDIFLFKKGDFFVHFIDNAEAELSKKVNVIIPSKIQSFLELSLRSSSVKDVVGLTAELSNLPIASYLDLLTRSDSTSPSSPSIKEAFLLNGIDAFTIRPAVPFPLSIVVNNSNVLKYQLLFRHLFQCKVVERGLLKAWIEHKYCKEFSLGNTIAPIYRLRQRMLHFVRELLFFSFCELEKNFVLMQKQIQQAETLDDIITLHQKFLDGCLTVSMLTLHKPYRALSQVLTVCKIFSEFMTQFTAGLTLDEDDNEYDSLSKKRAMSNVSTTAEVLAKRRTQIKVISEHARQNALSQIHINSIARFTNNFEESFQLLTDSLKVSGGTEANQLATHFEQIFSMSR